MKEGFLTIAFHDVEGLSRALLGFWPINLKFYRHRSVDQFQISKSLHRFHFSDYHDMLLFAQLLT